NRARDKGRQKRGGGSQRLELDRLAVADKATDEETLAVDEALRRLERDNKPCADGGERRVFAGLAMDEAAPAPGLAPRAGHRPRQGPPPLGLRPGLAVRRPAPGLIARPSKKIAVRWQSSSPNGALSSTDPRTAEGPMQDASPEMLSLFCAALERSSAD